MKKQTTMPVAESKPACLCGKYAEVLASRLVNSIKALNELYTLDLKSPRKLDMLFVLSNEINAENTSVVQAKNSQEFLKQRIEQIEKGDLTSSWKACVEHCLSDLKKNAPKSEYQKLLDFVDKYWRGQYTLPNDCVPEVKEADEVK